MPEDSWLKFILEQDRMVREDVRDSRAQWLSFTIMLVSLGVVVLAIIYNNLPTGIISSLATLFLALRVLFVKKNRNTHNRTPNNPIDFEQ